MGQGAFIFAPAGPILTPDEAAFFRAADPWGFIVFQRNCETPDQLRRLTSALCDAVGRDAPVLIDQEGGRVQRMRAPHWTEWMPPLDQVLLFSAPGDRAVLERSMYLRGRLIGAELLDHGIDVNCAPSADIAYPETHPFLRNRCYGTTPAIVALAARACAEGLMDSGCLPVLKHAPGHGRATLDSHASLPRIEVPLADLEDTDFKPFRDLSDLPIVMTAHIVLPEIMPDVPVTLSSDGVAFLRNALGLTGLLLTDDISMGALDGSLTDRAEGALAAGCDLVLHCNGDLGEMEQIATAAGAMGPSAVKRAYLAVEARRTPTDIDIPAFEAEFSDLIEGAKKHA